MATRTPAPTSYDDIARATVPNPDGSIQPTRAQVRTSHRASDAPTHAMTADERTLLSQIVAALALEGHTDTQHVDLLVQGSRVLLRGTVPGPSTSARVEDIAGKVDGVTEVWNELSIIDTDPTR